MPSLRPFRALRYDAATVGDLGAVLCPPYDVISADERARLAARHPRNAVRLELPDPLPGEPAESRYRAAARDLVAWRTDGTLRKDPRPSVYIHEIDPRGSGGPGPRGFFARLRLEEFGPEAGVRPHERTMTGPKEDRYRLLKQTGANLSPVVMLYDAPDRAAANLLDLLTRDAPTVEAVDGDGRRHRLWVHPVTPDDGSAAGELLRVAEARPVTIADGHHRYETALRYRAERGRNRACESDPPYDYVLVLLYDLRDRPPGVLATHRVVTGGPSGDELLRAAGERFHVARCTRDELVARMRVMPPIRPGSWGTGRFAVWSEGIGALLSEPEASTGSGPSGRRALETLDVTLLAGTLERIAGIDPDALAGGGRLTYTKDPIEALERVETGRATAAFLLDPTPAEAVLAVAAEGDVMPQKSTYFHPKAPTGLVFNPLES